MLNLPDNIFQTIGAEAVFNEKIQGPKNQHQIQLLLCQGVSLLRASQCISFTSHLSSTLDSEDKLCEAYVV